MRRFAYLFVIASLSLGMPLAVAAVGNLTWTSLSSGSLYFTDVATSDDGLKVIGVTTSLSERVMYSSNGGTTFTNIAPSRSTGSAAYFSSVAISGDGNVAYLTLESGGPSSGSKVFKTTNFSTWSQLSVGDTGFYRTVSTNTDGTRVLIGTASVVKASADSGSTWPTSSAFGVSGCDMSNTAQIMICFGDSGTFRVSTDYGVTWVSRAPSGTRFLFEDSAAVSGDGTTLYAIWSDWGAGYEGKSKVYKSTNAGVNWTEITANLPETAATANSGYRNYAVVDTSDNGSVVLVGSRGLSTFGSGYQIGHLYLSDDSGASWTKQTGPGSTYWSSVAVNSNGSKLYASIGLDYSVGGAIRGAGISFETPSTVNSLTLAGGVSIATYRVPILISANVSAAGRVTFRADGKRIGGCIQRATSGTSPNIVATCSYSPAKRGAVTLSASLDPTDALITNSTSLPSRILVTNRAAKR